MKKFEVKAIAQIHSVESKSADVVSDLQRYQAATTMYARHEIFDQLAAKATSEMSKQPVGDERIRRMRVDEFAGALNRRQFIEERFEAAVKEFNKGHGSFARSLAGVPSSISRD